ncbi:MAG: 4-hydroxy-tetrahydrodipicolinate synthase [Rhodothermales bacterium]|jgi:4-hydroxy-tetrahydrodipicolinate synthase
MSSFSGVWAASVTPLHDDLSVNHDKFAAHVQWLLSHGCDGVAVFGSTGEANSFSIQERVDALDALALSGVEMGRLVVGTGACAVADGVALSRHAVDAGCAGVLITPPFYYKGVTDDGIFAFFSQLVAGVDRPGRLRIVLYHFPRLVAVGFSEELIARLVAQWPSEIAAVKDSSGDLERMKRLVLAHPSMGVFTGNEKLLLDLLAAGGAGCLTASANLTSALAAAVVASRSPADQARLTAHREALSAAPFVAGLKQLLFERSGDSGWLNVRPPHQRLSSAAAGELRAAVERAVSVAGGVPNWG